MKELDRHGTDFFTKDSDNHRYKVRFLAAVGRMVHGQVLRYLMERNRGDTLEMIAAHNIARYVRNKVEALEIPEILKQLLAGFVENKDN